MILPMRKSGLADWMDLGTDSQRFWKVFFYCLSRTIIVLCLVQFLPMVFPNIRFEFPTPASIEFWGCCVVLTVLFTGLVYAFRYLRASDQK